jgi:ABC-2 type transport system permease protein
VKTFFDFLRANLLMTVRNKQALFWSFFFPVLLMCLLGVVFGQEEAYAPKLAIVDEDQSAASRAVVDVFMDVDALVTSEVDDEQTALDDLQNGDYAGVLVLPEGVQEQFASGTLEIPMYYDNSSMITAGTVTGVVDQVLRSISDQATGTQPKYTLAAQPVAAESFNYIDFLVPGVVAMALMTSGIYGVSGTFVYYRQNGVLRRLKATPMPLGSFVATRVLVHLVTALIQAGLVLLVGVVLFGVQVATGPTLLKVAMMALIGSSSFITIGFFIAAVSRNVEIAAALAQVIGTPMMFLSGIFFPMENAPAWIQPVVKAMPLAYLADALRDIIIKGETLWFVRLDIVVLSVTTAVFLALSVRFFRWE